MILRHIFTKSEAFCKFSSDKGKGIFADQPVRNPKHLAMEHARKINKLNKIFLGEKQNTSYLKVFKEQKLEDILKHSEIRGIKDLPFNTNYKQERQKSPLNPISKHMLEKVNMEELEQKLKSIAYGYFSDLVTQERNIKIEPNYEKQIRVTMKSFSKTGKKMSLEKNQNPEVLIKDLKVFKGLRINRNDNYSVDSYKKTQTDDGVTIYKLFETGIYDIPEEEWFSMRNVILRLTFMCNPCKLTITSAQNQQLYSDDCEDHEFTVEMNMMKPSRFSEYRLNFDEYIRKHSWAMQGLIITNVDRTNGYFEMTYSEEMKKTQLINSLL